MNLAHLLNGFARVSRSSVVALLPALFAISALSQEAPAAKAGKPPTAPPAQAKPWENIPIPKLHPFNPQQPKRIEFSNGLVIFLQEDHELPLISGLIRVRGGSRSELAAKAGLSRVLGQAWRTGGTASKTGDELDDFLEARAARVETGANLDSTTLSFSCLKADFPGVFPIAVEVLLHPAFRQDKVELAQRQISTGISRRNDDPGGIASREAARLGYGANSPYARVPEYYTVAAVTREDLVSWHDRYVHPNNMIIGVVGDFDSAAMEATLRQAFEGLPQGPAADRHPDIPITPAAPGVYFVQKDDVNQSTVVLVHLGIERNNPDYYAVEAMNEVLGGGFSGRLMSVCRSKRGLAYDVHGGVRSAFDHPGLFNLEMETKSSTTGAAIDCLYDQIDGMLKAPPSDAELKRAKDTILNNFIFAFDDKTKILAERMAYEFYGYPADFLERYRAGIEKVTTDDVERVARKYIHKNQVALLVVGNKADFDRALSTFGKVTPVNIAIPESAPGAPAASVPAASNPQGLALAAKVAAALGGAENLKAVKAVKQTMSSVRRLPQGEIPLDVEQTIVFPDQAYVSMKAPGATIVTVFTPAGGFMSMNDERQPLPNEMRDENLKNLHRDMIYISQHLGDPSFTFAASGTEKVGDIEAQILEVNAAGTPLLWYVDPATGHVLRARFHTLGMSGPLERVIEYSDWRPTANLTLPYHRNITENGEPASDDTIKQIELNPQVDPKLFETAAKN